MIGHEEGVELAGLQFLDQLLDAREIEIGIGPGAGIAPRAGMNGNRPHERAELKLPLWHLPVPYWLLLGKR